VAEAKKARKRLDPFDEMAQSLRPHPSKAQILIEVKPKGVSLDRALAVLKDMGIRPVLYRTIQNGDPAWVLLHLPAADMREAVFSLTEAGFTRLSGINPLTKKHNQKRS
jgi:hypothetical protein